jgi:hypothetical protein
MAIRYYLRNTGVSGTGGVDYPTSEQSADVIDSQSVNGTTGPWPTTVMGTTPSGVDGNGSFVWGIYNYVGASAAKSFVGFFVGPTFAAGSVAAGTFTIYTGARQTLPPSPPGAITHSFRVFVYLWRPGVGKVTDIVAPVTVGSVGGASFLCLKKTAAYSAFNPQAGDKVVFEVWGTSNYNSNLPPNSPTSAGFFFDSTDAARTDGSSYGDDNFASYIEFSNDFVPGSTTHDGDASVTGVGTVSASGDVIPAPVTHDGDASVSGSSSVSAAGYVSPFQIYDHREHILDAKTFALWRANEASGSTLTDETAGGRHLTLNGTHDIVAGKIGNARQYLRATGNNAARAGDAAAASLFIDGSYTVEAWVKFDSNFLSLVPDAGTLLSYSGNTFDGSEAGQVRLAYGFIPGTGGFSTSSGGHRRAQELEQFR